MVTGTFFAIKLIHPNMGGCNFNDIVDFYIVIIFIAIVFTDIFSSDAFISKSIETIPIYILKKIKRNSYPSSKNKNILQTFIFPKIIDIEMWLRRERSSNKIQNIIIIAIRYLLLIAIVLLIVLGIYLLFFNNDNNDFPKLFKFLFNLYTQNTGTC